MHAALEDRPSLLLIFLAFAREIASSAMSRSAATAENVQNACMFPLQTQPTPLNVSRG
jgi:hypothetical protein